MSKNFNIKSTIITDLIRISSAAIWYEYDNRYQIETWIFSSDERYKSTQVIHGSWHGDIGKRNPMIKYAKTFHEKVAYKFNNTFNVNS